MPALSIPSIALTLALSAMVMAFVLGAASRDRTFPIAGLRLWVAGVAGLALGLGFNAFQDRAPDLLARVASNTLLIGSVGLLGAGARVFQGRNANFTWVIALSLAALMVSSLWLYVWPMPRFRLVAISFLLAAGSAVASWEFARERRVHLRGAALIAALPTGLFAVLMVVRGIEGLNAPQVPVAHMPTPVNTLTYLLGGVVLLAWVASLLMLVNESRSGQLREWSFLDPLTGALNRRGLAARLDGWLARGVRPAALILLDGNGFKRVNDALGHAVGDELLRSLVACLDQSRPADSLLARMGGDEFVLLLRADVDAQDVLARASDCCRRSLRAAHPEFPWPEPLFSTGRAPLVAGDAASLERSLREADRGLSLGKRESASEASAH